MTFLNTPVSHNGEVSNGETICLSCLRKLRTKDMFTPIERFSLEEVKSIIQHPTSQANESAKGRKVSGVVTILLSSAILLFCWYSCSSNENGSENKADILEDEVTVTESQPADCNYFVICKSLTEFKKTVNTSLRDLQSSFQINEFILHDKEDGVCLAFEYTFDEELFITGSLNPKDNSMRAMVLAWVFKDNPTSYSSERTSLNFLGSINAILTATNPSLSASDKGEVLNDLGVFDFKADGLAYGESLKGETIRNGISYSINIIKGKAIFFVVEQPES